MTVKPGYIYVLTHPSDPDLCKIGVTVLEPKKRLAQHNSQLDKAAGRVVKETSQKWELKEYHPVQDPYWAERAFWGTTVFADIPYRYGVEVERMTWPEIQKGLEAAKRAGLRSEQPTPPVPDWVYKNTAAMRRRLEGRGITLLDLVKSMGSGKSNFKCINGHEWRTTPMLVAEGEGCPECGIGKCSHEKIRKMINAGVVCLLVHPHQTGFIKIGVSHRTPQELYQDDLWDGWEVHRYRNVEELTRGETLAWELLGHPLPHERQPLQIQLEVAEEAFRKLHYAITEQMALEEKRERIVATG